MLRIRSLNLVLPLMVLMAGACATPAGSPPAPTAPPPTVAPTAVPPTLTAVPATLAPTLTAEPPTLAPTTLPATLAPTPDLLASVTAFQAAYNKHDTDTLMALFAADPSWTLSFGMFAFAGSDSHTAYAAGTTQAVRDLLDIGFELNSHLEASNCSMKNNTATCAVAIKDDCNPPAVSNYHTRTQFAFEDGKISSVHGSWDISEENVFVPYDGARQEWAKQHLPAEAALYNAFSPDNLTPGLPPGETASQFGQAVERVCKAYAAAAH